MAAGPVQLASSSRSRRLSSTRARASSGSAPCSIVPASPSTTTNVPPARSMIPAAPTTQGMPSWRAMIAVWLVAPPRSVTRAVTRAGSRPEVSLGARSSATRIDGSLGVGTPGAGSPTRWATTRRSMSRRSVTRSAIRPPMVVKIVTNWSTAPCTAATGPWPACRFLSHRAAQALVAGEPGARGEHLGRRALGRGRLGGERVGDRGRRVVVRRQGRVGIGEVTVAEARDRIGRDLAADVEDGAGGDARHDRGPAQGRVWSWTHRRTRSWLTGNTFGTKTTHTQIASRRGRPCTPKSVSRRWPS